MLAASADDAPDAVVQGFAPELGWKDLAEAAFALADPDRLWVATNTDWTIPVDRGIAPGNGTLVSAVHAAVGRLPVVAGKPETPLFTTAVERFSAERPFFVGDRLDTDIKGANAAGMPSALVLTGIDGAKELHRRRAGLASAVRARGPPGPARAVSGGPAPRRRRPGRQGDRPGAAASTSRSCATASPIDLVRAAAEAVWTLGRRRLRPPDPGGRAASAGVATLTAMDDERMHPGRGRVAAAGGARGGLPRRAAAARAPSGAARRVSDERVDLALVARGLVRSRSAAQAAVAAGRVLRRRRGRRSGSRSASATTRCSRSTAAAAGSAAARASSTPRSTPSASTSRAGPRSTSARRPAGSRRCCSSAERDRSWRSTSATTSSRPSCGRTRGSSSSRGRTPAPSPPSGSPSSPARSMPPDVVVADLSFISLTLVLPAIAAVAGAGRRRDLPDQAAVRGRADQRARRSRAATPATGSARCGRCSTPLRRPDCCTVGLIAVAGRRHARQPRGAGPPPPFARERSDRMGDVDRARGAP